MFVKMELFTTWLVPGEVTGEQNVSKIKRDVFFIINHLKQP